MGALWAFLNSPIGYSLVLSILGKIFTTQVKSANRRTQILGYVDTAFQIVDVAGKQLGWSGHEKYTHFVEMVVDSLKAANQPPLTGKEMAELQRMAQVKAMLAKPRTPPLPLPSP